MSYQKKLQQLADQYDIHGDLQWRISQELSLSNSSSLFEFLDAADAKEVFEVLELRGVENVLGALNTQHSTLNTIKENEVPTSTNDDGESPQIGSAVATTPGGETTAAPSFQLREVFDAERGELVQRSADQQAAAHSLYSLMKMADLAQAILLKKFLDGNHHLDLGYSTKEEFYQQELGQSRSNVSKKLKIASRFESIIPIANVSPAKQLTENESVNLDALNQIGLHKLYEVAKIDDADFEDVLTSGVVKFGDGREVPLEDIQLRTRNEIAKLMKDEIDGYKKRNANLLDKNSELEAQLKSATKKADELAAEQEAADRLDLMYGDQAATVQGLERLLKEVEEAARLTNRLLVRIKTNENTPEDLCLRIVQLHRVIDAGRQKLMDNNLFAFDAEPTVNRNTTQFGSYTVDEDTGEIIDQQPEPENEV